MREPGAYTALNA